MGYRIEYEGGMTTKKMKDKRKIRLKPALVLIAAVAVAIMLVWPTGRIWVRDLILPGNEEITATALSGLVTDLRSGEPMGEALEVFCKGIIAGE